MKNFQSGAVLAELEHGSCSEDIPEKEAILFYIGGDRQPFNARSTKELLSALSKFHFQEKRKRLTPMEFAEQNRGNFVIMTLRWFNVDAD